MPAHHLLTALTTITLLCLSAAPAFAQSTTTITVTEGASTRTTTFKQASIKVGRYDSNDLVLTNRKVSRRHCAITVDGGVASVDDLDSTNGTRVNGRRIRARTALGPNDTVRVGPYTLKVTVRAAKKEPTSAKGVAKDDETGGGVAVSQLGTLMFTAIEPGVRSVAAYNGIEFRLKLAGGSGGVINLKPSSSVSRDQLKKLAGRKVKIMGEFVKGKAPDPMEQAPLGPDGKPQRRPDYYRVRSIKAR